MNEITKNSSGLLAGHPPLVFWVLNKQTQKITLVRYCGLCSLIFEIEEVFPDEYSYSYSRICKLASEIRKSGLYPSDQNMERTVRRAIHYFNDYLPWHYSNCNVMIDFWWNEAKSSEGMRFYG